MSFLNSVLSSIGGNAAQSFKPPAQRSRSPGTNEKLAATPTQLGTPPATNGQPSDKKRKADYELQRSNGKLLKGDVVNRQTPFAKSSSDLHLANSSSHEQKPASLPKPPIPNRDISKPITVSDSASNKPLAQAPKHAETTKAPKKGSYAEIMARANASQSKPPAIGVINHMPKDKMAISYKKELKLRKKALKNKKFSIQSKGRPGSSGSLSGSPAPVSVEKGKPSQPAYKGTAKPKLLPNYKGTIKSGSTTVSTPLSRDRNTSTSRNRYDEYAATDEEDLDEVDECDYESEESDDMEAGFSDVEQEETVAAKAARKEDEEEAKLEARLKSEKEDRKRRLEAMAKKAKPQRF